MSETDRFFSNYQIPMNWTDVFRGENQEWRDYCIQFSETIIPQFIVRGADYKFATSMIGYIYQKSDSYDPIYSLKEAAQLLRFMPEKNFPEEAWKLFINALLDRSNECHQEDYCNKLGNTLSRLIPEFSPSESVLSEDVNGDRITARILKILLKRKSVSLSLKSGDVAINDGKKNKLLPNELYLVKDRPIMVRSGKLHFIDADLMPTLSKYLTGQKDKIYYF